MPEFTIHLDDPQDAIANLRQAGGIGLAEQIERQLPKAPTRIELLAAEFAAENGHLYCASGPLTRFAALVVEGTADQIDWITRDAIDEALSDPSRAGNCAAKARKAVLELLTNGAPESTPGQVEAALTPGVPVESVKRLYAQLQLKRDMWASGTLGQDMLTDFIADVEGLLPKEPTA